VTVPPVSGPPVNEALEAVLPSARSFAISMPSRFRGITVREGALIEGPAGWGEFSPFAEYGPAECSRWLACALEAACTGWPAPVRDHIPVNCTIPVVSPERAAQLAAGSGCRTAKIKVADPGRTGSDWAANGRAANDWAANDRAASDRAATDRADIARVAAVREALGPAGRIRVDANGGWDTDHAAAMLAALAPYQLEYAEQPCATLAELAELRRRTDVPLAADESIRRAEDPLAVRAAGAADLVVLKVQPLGGVRAALRVAQACGLPVVVSSAVETSIGLAAGIALAAALPELPYDCGLATMSLLNGDVTSEPLATATGTLPVRAAVVDPGQLSAWETDPAPWVARMRAAAAHLPASSGLSGSTGRP
jgi:O-succinylbenzoate synthase